MSNIEKEKALDILVEKFDNLENSSLLNKDESSKIFYHGSSFSFDEFDLSKSKDGWFGKCIYFTDNKTLAKGFGKYIYEVELDIKNPYFSKSNDYFGVMGDVNKEFNKDGLQETDISKVLAQNGFDGIVYDTHWDRDVGNIYTVFNPSQIKIISKEEVKRKHHNKSK